MRVQLGTTVVARLAAVMGPTWDDFARVVGEVFADECLQGGSYNSYERELLEAYHVMFGYDTPVTPLAERLKALIPPLTPA